VGSNSNSESRNGGKSVLIILLLLQYAVAEEQQEWGATARGKVWTGKKLLLLPARLFIFLLLSLYADFYIPG
jgi:hypothetical protein